VAANFYQMDQQMRRFVEVGRIWLGAFPTRGTLAASDNIFHLIKPSLLAAVPWNKKPLESAPIVGRKLMEVSALKVRRPSIIYAVYPLRPFDPPG
jgi:hypothetical protein